MRKESSKNSEENLKQKLFEFQKELEDFGKHISQSISIKMFGERFCLKMKEFLLCENIGLFYKPLFNSDWEYLVNFPAFDVSNISNLKIGNFFEIKENPQQNISLIINIPFDDQQTFLIIVGSNRNSSDFSSFQKVVLNLFIQFLKNSYQAFSSKQKEKSLRFLLNERSVQLNNLIETGIIIANINNQKKILELALERAVSLTNSSKGYIKIFHQGELINKYFFPVSFALQLDRIQPNFLLSKTFSFLENEYEITIFEKESRNGIIQYEEMDELILDAISRQIKAAIENEYLYNDIIERKRKEQEKLIADTINDISKTKILPKINGFDVFGINLPAVNPDADYYDIIPLSNGNYAFIIADVAGKGISASILDTILKATLYALLESNYSLINLAEKLNQSIFNVVINEKNITCVIGILNYENKEIEILNAGHISPIISLSGNAFKRIEQTGISLGNPPNKVEFYTQKFYFGEGDRLFLFTNGIYSSTFNDDSLSNDKYLEKYFIENKNNSAENFINSLISNIKEKNDSNFDLTAMYIKRT